MSLHALANSLHNLTAKYEQTFDEQGLIRNHTFCDKFSYTLTTASVYFTTPWEIEGCCGCLRYQEPWRKVVLTICAMIMSGCLFFIPTIWGGVHRLIESCCGGSESKLNFDDNQEVMREQYLSYHRCR